MNRMVTVLAAIFFAACVNAADDGSRRYVLTEHGIPANDGVVRTAEIQSLIDRAASSGGGVVVVPPGRFVTGGLHFSKGVNLHIEKDAVLQASDDISHYALGKTRLRGVTLKYFCAVINAINADGFTLTGSGTIDGNGFKAWRARWLRRQWNPNATGLDEQRPRLLFVSGSDDVRIEGVTFLNPPFWTTHYYDCKRLKIINVTTKSEIAPDGTKGPAVDGMDLDGVEDVLIKGCNIDNNDDGIVFKGGYGPWADDPSKSPDNRPNRNIVIEDCTFGPQCHACVGCGSECYYVSNVIFRNSYIAPGAWNAVRFKIRPDTPQKYMDFRIEGLRGSPGNFMIIDTFPRNPVYYTFGDRKDIPKSYVTDIRARDVVMNCRKRLHTWLDPKYPDKTVITGLDIDSVKIDAPAEWIEIGNPSNVVAGSALDLSAAGFRDAPAGKYGWLKVAPDGHFEFENRPGKRINFFGVNLCGKACLPDRDLADEVVGRLSRMGWDSVRLHHYDKPIASASGDGTSLDPKAMESFDYLYAKLREAGFYITLDLYDSRTVTWKHLGIKDHVGKPLTPNAFKCLVPFNESAFANWCSFVRNLLCHRNPHTGLRYVDDPAMPLFILLNENRLATGDWWKVRKRPETLKAYAAWLDAKKAQGVEFPSDAVMSPDDFGNENFYSTNNAVLAMFMADTEAALVRRQKEFLASIGSKALVSGNDCGPWFAAMQPMRAESYDFVDAHWYGGKPRFLAGKWGVPCRIETDGALDHYNNPAMTFTEVSWVRVFGKPFTSTEWNFAGTWAERSSGGLYAGARAARQDWDGIWHFAYAQGLGSLRKGNGIPNQYNVCADPVMRLGSYAVSMLFRRGDLAPCSTRVAFPAEPPPLPASGPAKAASPAPESLRDIIWRAQVGTAIGASRPSDPELAQSGDGAVTEDRGTGCLKVVSPRTAGAYLPANGSFEAGPLRCNILGGGSATVWASSLDGDRSLDDARRVVLFHVTDVRADGYRLKDGDPSVLECYGKMPLVARVGEAEVLLSRRNGRPCTVWALDLSGKRIEEVPSRIVNGALSFRAMVAGPPGARFVYEIAEKPVE